MVKIKCHKLPITSSVHHNIFLSSYNSYNIQYCCLCFTKTYRNTDRRAWQTTNIYQCEKNASNTCKKIARLWNSSQWFRFGFVWNWIERENCQKFNLRIQASNALLCNNLTANPSLRRPQQKESPRRHSNQNYDYLRSWGLRETTLLASASLQ